MILKLVDLKDIVLCNIVRGDPMDFETLMMNGYHKVNLR